MSHPSILFLITSLERGGAEKQLAMLALALKQRGWNPIVISLTGIGHFGVALRSSDIAVHALEMHRSLPSRVKGVLRLQRLICQYQPEVLCSFLFHANLLARILGALCRTKVVVCSIRNERETPREARAHAVPGPSQRSLAIRLRMLVMRLTRRLCDMNVVNAKAVGAALESQGVLDSKWRVIPNGVESFDASPPDMHLASSSVANKFQWLAVGGLVPLKGYSTLLEAWAYLIGEHPRAQLQIAGEGGQRREIECSIASTQVTSSVTLLGFRSDVSDLLAKADALVHPSWTEASPNVILEALSAGKPIVACRVGGVPEIVKEGLTGYLVPPRNATELAKAMAKVMNLSVHQRLEMGRFGKADIATRFSMTAVVQSWEDLLLSLLAAKT